MKNVPHMTYLYDEGDPSFLSRWPSPVLMSPNNLDTKMMIFAFITAFQLLNVGSTFSANELFFLAKQDFSLVE